MIFPKFAFSRGGGVFREGKKRWDNLSSTIKAEYFMHRHAGLLSEGSKKDVILNPQSLSSTKSEKTQKFPGINKDKPSKGSRKLGSKKQTKW